MTMQYKSYGQTGKKISVIGFGGMRFENHDDIQGNAELLLYAKEKGINYFDTAPGYCGTKSENIMGAAFKQMKRDQFYISSKSGQADGEKLLADLHTSLERLNLDYLWIQTSTGNHGDGYLYNSEKRQCAADSSLSA